MINTIIPRVIGTIEKDGKKVNIPIPPRLALLKSGALVRVTITHPKSIIEELAKENKTPKETVVNALIDTGAASCIISPKIAEELELIQTGFRKVTSVQDEQQRPVYYCSFVLPWGSMKEISAASCPLKDMDCIIGRDIMMHWHFTYNGKDGIITICD